MVGWQCRCWRVLTAVSLALASVVIGVSLHASPALAASAHYRGETIGNQILDTAETRLGDWYSWGGTGPYSFDCSGLVVWAAAQHGIYLPRTTYGMLAGSPHLRWVPLSQARRGDLAFYGSGHVELVTARGTFGAAAPGTRVYWHYPSVWWHPTMFFRVR